MIFAKVNTIINSMKNISAANKGIIIAGILIIISLVWYYLFHIYSIAEIQPLLFCIYFIGVIWSVLSQMKNNQINTFKDYFSEGFKTFIVITLFMIIFTFVFYKLNPQIIEKVIQENNQMILKGGNRTKDEINANAAELRKNAMPMLLFFNTLLYLLMGSIATGLSSLIASIKNNSFIKN